MCPQVTQGSLYDPFVHSGHCTGSFRHSTLAVSFIIIIVIIFTSFLTVIEADSRYLRSCV